MSKRIAGLFEAAVAAHVETLRQSATSIQQAAEAMRSALDRGGKILAFGNGGSATDAQHFAAELVNRFQIDRPALAAIALTTDTSILTSIANDSSYDRVFARQLEALAKPGDIALAITTSGKSPSVLAALAEARRMKLTTVALLGATAITADIAILTAASVTARVQEVHRTILHVLCELIES